MSRTDPAPEDFARSILDEQPPITERDIALAQVYATLGLVQAVHNATKVIEEGFEVLTAEVSADDAVADAVARVANRLDVLIDDARRRG